MKPQRQVTNPGSHPRLAYVAHRVFPDGSRALRWPQAPGSNRRILFCLFADGTTGLCVDASGSECLPAQRFSIHEPETLAIKQAFAAYASGGVPKFANVLEAMGLDPFSPEQI